MKLIFHGGANEVGRSCIELDCVHGRFLLDCGIKITPDGLEYPSKFEDLKNIDAVFLSHAHLDHSGALPLFKHYDIKAKIFTTKGTARISDILLKDSYRLDILKHHHPAYTEYDIKSLENQMSFVSYKKKYQDFGFSFSFYNSGHIPGSASIKLNVEGQNILYTGDINLEDTMLVQKADLNYGPVDVLIIESTYGKREHEPRNEVEEKLVEGIVETLRRGGKVLIPVFGVGRAQEILMILNKYHFDAPIYIDGMARKVTNIMINNASNLKNPLLMKLSYKRAKEVKNRRMREIIMKKRGIFVTTSGMLEGGPVISYLKQFHNDERSSIFLTGYQCEGTNGRLLLDEGYVFLDGTKIKVRMHYEKLDFSAHAGMSQLHEIVKKTNPQKIIVQHGDPDEVAEFADWCRQNINAKVYAPKLNDKIEL